MADAINALRWDRSPGHYEVYYLTVTDRASGVGLWIRLTMVAPVSGEATCALWFLAMDPRERDERGAPLLIGRKATYPIGELAATTDPFQLDVANATLTDRGSAGAFEDVRWELSWTPSAPGREYVPPLLQRARVAKTIPAVAHPDLEVHGSVSFAGRELAVHGRGAQTHLWGSKHSARWVWAHGGDFETHDGQPQPGTWVDGISAHLPRFGRELGPLTMLLGNVAGRDVDANGPVAMVRTKSVLALTGWSFEARAGSLKLVGEVDADRDALVGVVYHDPDGEQAYCYNTEIATMRLAVWEKPDGAPWRMLESIVSPGRAHFEYAQRTPVPGIELHVK